MRAWVRPCISVAAPLLATVGALPQCRPDFVLRQARAVFGSRMHRHRRRRVAGTIAVALWLLVLPAAAHAQQGWSEIVDVSAAVTGIASPQVAIDRHGNAVEIRIFVNVPAPPSAPANLLGLANGAGLALSWRNTFEGGAPTSLWLKVTGAIATVLPLPMGEAFTFANVPPGTYTLSVIAANASGASPPSNAVTLTFPHACSGVPDMPTNLQTWKAGNTIFLSWSPPASGPAVTSYRVAVSGAWVGGFTTPARTLSGEAAPGSYVITVSATNACGVGPPSAAQTVVTP